MVVHISSRNSSFSLNFGEIQNIHVNHNEIFDVAKKKIFSLKNRNYQSGSKVIEVSILVIVRAEKIDAFAHVVGHSSETSLHFAVVRSVEVVKGERYTFSSTLEVQTLEDALEIELFL